MEGFQGIKQATIRMKNDIISLVYDKSEGRDGGVEEWREILRARWAQMVAYCHAHPKESVETALLAVLLFVAGAWYFSGKEEAVAVQPKEEMSSPKKETKPAGTRVTVKGAELAAEGGELTNPFSFEHETRKQMAATPPKKQKEKETADEKQTKTVAAAVPSAPANAPGPAMAVGESSTTPQEPVAPPLVLKGVAISETDAMAVVIEYGTRKFVHIGEAVAGMSVTAIDRDSITLEGDDGTTVLRMPPH